VPQTFDWLNISPTKTSIFLLMNDLPGRRRGKPGRFQ